MKTAMKKIMTLLLVAMLLVTAIPFTAFAAEGNGFTGVYLQVWKNGKYETVRSNAWIEGNGDPKTKTPRDLLNHLFGGWESEYEFVEADAIGTGIVGIDDTIYSAVSPEVYLHMKSKGVYYADIQFKQYKNENNVLANKTITKVDNGSDPRISYDEIANMMPKPQEGMESYSIASISTPNGTLNPGSYYTGTYGQREQFIAYVNVTNNGEGGGQTPVSKNVNLTVMNGSTTLLSTKTIELNGDSAPLKNILRYHWDETWTEKYDYSSDSLGRGLEGTIKGGESVTVYVTSKSSKPDPEPTVKDIKFVVTIGTTADNAKESSRGSFIPAQNGTYKVGDILTNMWKRNWKDAYKFENAYVSGVGSLGENEYVRAGETVTIRVSAKNSSGGSTGDGGHNKFPYDVYLHVYLNNNLDAAHKTFDITDGIAADGVVDKNDIWNNLLKNYYSAKDSKGVTIELYEASGNWVKDFAADNQTDRIDNILDLRDDGYVHINVVLNNAKSKTSSSNNADPNNPKTGDSIGTVISVMGLSATALATMFFFNKKRIFG